MSRPVGIPNMRSSGIADRGCWAAPRCVTCPHERCIEDMTTAEVADFRRTLGRNVDLGERRVDVATELGVSVRTVQRMRTRAGVGR